MLASACVASSADAGRLLTSDLVSDPILHTLNKTSTAEAGESRLHLRLPGAGVQQLRGCLRDLDETRSKEEELNEVSIVSRKESAASAALVCVCDVIVVVVSLARV